jgi:hypothetical protein
MFCQVDGCTRPHKARGLCQTHYAQYIRGVELTPIRSRVREKPPECVEEGCAEPVKSKGLCKMHYQRLLRHGHTRYRDRKKPAKQCTIDGCDNIMYAKNLCHQHYIKQLKWQAYGVDAERYQEMLREQGGVCAICNQRETVAARASGKRRDLSVDHNHVTGAVRALLCSACNTAIGLFNEDPALLDRAKSYLLCHGCSKT